MRLKMYHQCIDPLKYNVTEQFSNTGLALFAVA